MHLAASHSDVAVCLFVSGGAGSVWVGVCGWVWVCVFKNNNTVISLCFLFGFSMAVQVPVAHAIPLTHFLPTL